MKIKNATEMMMFAVASQLPTVAAFPWFSDDLRSAELRPGSAALAPSSTDGHLSASCLRGRRWPKSAGTLAQAHGITERHDTPNNGPSHPFMLFRRRSSGSLRVAISPEGLRQAIAQACGEPSLRLRARPVRRPESLRHFECGKKLHGHQKTHEISTERTVFRCSQRRKSAKQ